MTLVLLCAVTGLADVRTLKRWKGQGGGGSFASRWLSRAPASRRWQRRSDFSLAGLQKATRADIDARIQRLREAMNF